MPPNSTLSHEQGLALLSEIESARNLLAYGLHVLRTGAFIETTRDPVLTVLSIGMEKLYKITLGLIAVEQKRQWPSITEMRKWNHDLLKMHEEIMGELRSGSANKSMYLREIVSTVDNDPVVQPLIRSLSHYGLKGRFYYLDALANSPQLIDPLDLWQSVETAALNTAPVAAKHRVVKSSIGDNDALNELTRAVQHRIAEAAERVWVAIAACASNGLMGAWGKSFGAQVDPIMVGRQ